MNNHPNLVVADGLLALVLTGVALVRIIGFADPIEPVAIALIALSALCIGWRRIMPVAVLIVSASCFCVYLSLGFPHTALPLPVLIALYTVAAYRGALLTAGLAVAVALGAIGSGLRGRAWSAEAFDDQVIAYFMSVGAACALGYAVQLSRARSALLREQAARLEAQHAAREQESLRQEHARIARELHDVVAHQVSLISALAAGAGRVLDTEPERTRRALHAIEVAGREALTEMRRLLRVLRADKDSLDPDPAPSLEHIPALIERTVRAGLPVQLSVQGRPRPVPAEVQMCAFRIVQEALTNILKHAGAARAAILIDYQPAQLELRVQDDGRGLDRDSPGAGQGLIGMRERAGALGGGLVVRSRLSGGVEVCASLPLPAAMPLSAALA